MYKNLLVPVLVEDGQTNDPSFAAARVLADEHARFTLLHVMEPMPAYFTTEIPMELLEGHREETTKRLLQMNERFPEAEIKLITGHAGRAIVDHAASIEADCIILNSHKPGVQDFFLGSTASRVVRHAKCSVHVLR